MDANLVSLAETPNERRRRMCATIRCPLTALSLAFSILPVSKFYGELLHRLANVTLGTGDRWIVQAVFQAANIQ